MGSNSSQLSNRQSLCVLSVSSQHVYAAIPYTRLRERQPLHEAIGQIAAESGRESTPSPWVPAPCCCLPPRSSSGRWDRAHIHAAPHLLTPAPLGIGLGSLYGNQWWLESSWSKRGSGITGGRGRESGTSLGAEAWRTGNQPRTQI